MRALSLSLSHTHTHKRARAHTCALASSLSLSLSLTHTHTSARLIPRANWCRVPAGRPARRADRLLYRRACHVCGRRPEGGHTAGESAAMRRVRDPAGTHTTALDRWFARTPELLATITLVPVVAAALDAEPALAVTHALATHGVPAEVIGPNPGLACGAMAAHHRRAARARRVHRCAHPRVVWLPACLRW